MKKGLLKQIEIFDLMLENELSPNQYYLLCCIRDSVTPGGNINIHLELRNLKAKGWLDDNNKLLPKAFTLIDKIEKVFKLKKKITSSGLMGKDYKENIAKYREIYPNQKLGSGHYGRTSVKNLEKCFRWFFEEYDYEWDTIFKAAQMYIMKEEVDGYKYTQRSDYLVRKNNYSQLANLCDAVLSGVEEQEEASIVKVKVV